MHNVLSLPNNKIQRKTFAKISFIFSSLCPQVIQKQDLQTKMQSVEKVVFIMLLRQKVSESNSSSSHAFVINLFVVKVALPVSHFDLKQFYSDPWLTNNFFLYVCNLFRHKLMLGTICHWNICNDGNFCSL